MTDLVFDMGKYAAALPGDRSYCRNHMWCRPQPGGRLRFGFTSYAVRLMQDVYFLDWCVDSGSQVAAKQKVGNLESSKALSDLYAPLSGTLTQFNAELLADPSGINVGPYEGGWLFEMDADSADTLSVAEYRDFLAANWERTQNMLKGQV